jgi:hypothetical protein
MDNRHTFCSICSGANLKEWNYEKPRESQDKDKDKDRDNDSRGKL